MAADVLGRDFTMVHNAALRDRRLTRRARGLLVEVLSHRAGFGISEASLVAAGPEGRDAVRKALRELEEHGYLHREQARAGGRFGETVFRLTDMPEGLTVRVGSPWTDSQSTEQNPRSGPLTEKPTTEKPTTENPQHKKTKFQKTNLSPAPEPPSAPSTGVESETDERENSATRDNPPTPAAPAADTPPETATGALCAAWASGAGIPRTPATIARQIATQTADLTVAYPNPEQQRTIAEFAGRHRWTDLERAAMHPDCARLIHTATRPASTHQPAEQRATAIADCNACDQYGWLLTDDDTAARKCRHTANPPAQQAA